MINVNTYSMNSITTTRQPLLQSSDVKHQYLYAHEFNTYLIQSQCQYLPLEATTILMMIPSTPVTQQMLPRSFELISTQGRNKSGKKVKLFNK